MLCFSAIRNTSQYLTSEDNHLLLLPTSATLYLSPHLISTSFRLFLSSDSDEGEQEDDSGTDEDETPESQEERQKRIPVWAKGALLKEALEKVSHCVCGVMSCGVM
jgi:hypothetical protein